MAPRERRRGLALRVLLPILLLSLSSAPASAASAVLGLDIGTEYLKAALVKPGIPLEVVLTKDSKRKETAALAFKPSRSQISDQEAFPERLYGGDALALAARYPGDVYPNLKSLLGQSRGSSAVKDYIRRFPDLEVDTVGPVDHGVEREPIGFTSKSFGEDGEPFLVEELLAMQLKNIKTNAETTAGKGAVVTDVVITVPSFYTAEEKKALELAADLAGLRVLCFISDGLAVGVNYATTRNFGSVSEGAKPEYHLVYDMGAGSTTATVLKFQGRTVKDVGKRNKTIQEIQVLGAGHDRTLGGDILNQMIVDDMIEQFLETTKSKAIAGDPIDVERHAKTLARLWKDAERIRQVLSANSQTSTTFEGLLYDDVNFKYTLSRTDFEKMASKYASRVSLPLTDALDSAKLKLEDLESIILHGGLVRTPFVQRQIEALAGAADKIKTNVNADEAAVLGAAFKAAGISPSFRVKDIRASDISVYPVLLKWEADGKQRQQKLFTSTSQIGAEKQVPMKILENAKFHFIQLVTESEQIISEVQAANLTASVAQLEDKHGCDPANITTKLTVRLSPVDGLPEIISGTVSCEVETNREGGVMDNVKGLFGFGSKKASEQKPFDTEEEFLHDTTSSIFDPSEPSSTSTLSNSVKVPAPTPSIVSVPLSLVTHLNSPHTPSASSLNRIKSRLRAFDSSDQNRMLRAEALNTLEGYTYRARDYLSDESFIAASTDEAREILEEKVNAASAWLYSDGVDARLQDFKDKLKDLKDLVDSVLNRRDEAIGRDAAVKAVKEGLDQLTAMIKMVEGGIEKAAEDAASGASSAGALSSSSHTLPQPLQGAETDDLDDDPYSSPTSMFDGSSPKTTPSPPQMAPYTAEDLASLRKTYETVSAWLEEKLASQAKLAPYDDPAVLVADLELRARQLQSEVTDLFMKNIRMPKAGAVGGSSKKSKVYKSKQKKGTGKPSTSIADSSSGGGSTIPAGTTAENTPRVGKIKDEL